MKDRVKLKFLRNEISKKHKQVKNRNQLIYRRNAKIKKLNFVLNHLHENNYLSRTEFENLQQISNKSGALISRFLVKVKGQKVPKIIQRL